MADARITDLTADTSPQSVDLVATARSPFGAGSNRKVTLADVLKGAMGGYGSADQILGMNGGASGFEYKTIAAGSGISVLHSANTITISASGALSGSGTNGQVALWNGSSTLAGDTGLTYAGSGNTYHLKFGAAADVGIQRAAAAILNITDGSTGYGSIRVADGSASMPALSFGSESDLGIYRVSSGILGFSDNGLVASIQSGAIKLKSDTGAYYLGASDDVVLIREAANTLAMRNTTSAQLCRLYNTYTSATSYERANMSWISNVFTLGTEKGSGGGSARGMAIQTDATDRITIGATGDIALLANTTISDSLFFLQDNADNTKKLQFQLSGVSTGTTRTLTVPDASTTLVGTDVTQTLTNKTIGNTNTVTLKDTLFTLQDDGDASKQVVFQLSDITTATTRTLTVPDASITLVGTSNTQTLSNKTLDNTTNLTIKDTLFTLQDNSDTSKQAAFELSGITTATTRTYTLPDASVTLVGDSNTQTISGAKTFSSTYLTLGVASTTTTGLRFYNSASANATILQAGNASAAVTYTLPLAAPAADGYVLSCTTGGTMSWAAGGGGSTVGYTFVLAHSSSLSPGDAITYYWGATYGDTISTTAGNARVYIPKAGTIKVAYVFLRNTGTLGTGETSTISIRLNNTSDTTISSSVTTNSAIQVFSNTGLSLSVTEGDYIEIKWVTPTWTTNPTGLRFNIVIYIE